MEMKRTLCRTSCLVTLLAELSWINGSLGLQREAGSRVAKQWERKVRSASGLDELLGLADFPDWKLWKCRMRLQQSDSLFWPPLAGSHRSTRYAAESYSLEILKECCVSHAAIDEEWQRTQCMPRETCVDVAKELGTAPSMFFKPPCVSVHRCSGCCNQDGVTCRNTSTVLVNKTVLSVFPFKFVPEPVLIKVANHTECRCMEPAIIRRNAQPQRSSGCSLISLLPEAENSMRLCVSGWIWDCASDRCIPYPSGGRPELPPTSRMPDCEIDVERCDCIPRAEPTAQLRPVQRCHLNSSICSHRRQYFDPSSCRCKWPK
ncbi:vascular endothelial growth factor D [Phyllopteryx taeniolatus]|uniref:vascular endothelial growth factor D n=1 Tax=Phyllopteryx taeniolatus TaxID=161469 RepID=UPI002AD2274F|nr:vascular endothelial growth factor D [Phyllopteryx taeniolatus]XP_061608756.1 vascular endothelial growth factor D [Phyllopteryx taeniolatus]